MKENTRIVISDRYELREKLGEGSMSRLFAAKDLQEKTEIAVKILKEEVISSNTEDLRLFQYDHKLLNELKEPGAGKVYSVVKDRGMLCLVMELIKGESLQDLLDKGEFFSPRRTAGIIWRVAEILKNAHQAGVLHRDLKPGNIIITKRGGMKREDSNLKLVDFGVARLKEFTLEIASHMAGSLHYMSPEQSGAIRRRVDERSDLYSLGVVFYRLLTGRLPFESSNLSSIIHQHIARVPEAPSYYNPGVPGVLDEMVIKLLEKEPEKRYQDAGRLQSDLEMYLKEGRSLPPELNHRAIAVGEADMVNREQEMDRLVKAYHSARRGEGSFCLLLGGAGSGKSRMVEEIRKYALERQGTFIQGFCREGVGGFPYAPFKEALHEYTTLFNGMPAAKQEEIRERVKDNVGNLGRVITRFSPLTKQMLKDTPPLVELKEERARQRFHLAVSRFFFSMGKKEAPLVIALEDLQHVDNGTVELLQELSSSIHRAPVLLIGTCRKEEVESNSSFSVFLNRNYRLNYPLEEVELHPLDLEDIRELATRILGKGVRRLNEITSKVMEYSGGNPSVTVEMLRKPLREINEGKSSNLEESLSKLLDEPGMENHDSPRVEEEALCKIPGLPAREENVLRCASVLGHAFDLRQLFYICDLAEEEVIEILEHAVRRELIVPYTYEQRKFSFVDPITRRAFYQQLSSESKRELHKKAALKLEEEIAAGEKQEVPEEIYSLAFHFSRSGNERQAWYYNFRAGVHAKKSYALKEAQEYLEKARELYEKSKEDAPSYYSELLKNLGSVYFALGENRKAGETYHLLASMSGEGWFKAEIYLKLTRIYLVGGDLQNCEKYAARGLKILGEAYPVNSRPLLTLTVEKVRRRFRLFFSLYYRVKIRLSKNESQRWVERLRFRFAFLHQIGWAYILSDTLKYACVILKMLNDAEVTPGALKEKAQSMNGYAALLMAMGDFEEAAKYYKHSLSLLEETEQRWSIGRTYQSLGYLHEWKGDYPGSRKYFQESLEIFQEIGDLKEYWMCMNGIVHSYYYLSEYEMMKQFNERYREQGEKYRDSYVLISSKIYYVQYYRETGDLDTSMRYGEESIEEAWNTRDWFQYCSALIETGITCWEREDYRQSVEYLEKAADIKGKYNILHQYTVLLFPFLVEAYVAEYQELRGRLSRLERKKYLKKINSTLKLAFKNTGNWPTHYGGTLLAAAKAYWLLGRESKAKGMFKKSEEHLRNLGRKYELARALYSAGKFLEYQGFERLSRAKLEEAYLIIQGIKARQYQKRLSAVQGREKEGSDYQSERLAQDLRYAGRMLSIIELSRELSSVLDPEELLRKTVDMAVEISGAQAGYLVIKGESWEDAVVYTSKNMEAGVVYRQEILQKLVEEVLAGEKPVLIADAAQDDRIAFLYDSVEVELKSLLCVPLKYQKEIKGVCYLENNLYPGVFTEEDLGVLEVIMGQAAISLENAKLYEQAITDDLTGMFTLKYFKMVLQQELKKAEENNSELALVMMDIDWFRNFNNTYGHQAGDQVLIKIAESIKHNSRGSDLAARYGGEEFVILLPETGLEGGWKFAEKLRRALESMEVQYCGQKLGATASFGVSIFPSHARESESLIRAADEAMYISKREGRNLVTVYPQT